MPLYIRVSIYMHIVSVRVQAFVYKSQHLHAHWQTFLCLRYLSLKSLKLKDKFLTYFQGYHGDDYSK